MPQPVEAQTLQVSTVELLRRSVVAGIWWRSCRRPSAVGAALCSVRLISEENGRSSPAFPSSSLPATLPVSPGCPQTPRCIAAAQLWFIYTFYDLNYLLLLYLSELKLRAALKGCRRFPPSPPTFDPARLLSSFCTDSFWQSRPTAWYVTIDVDWEN